MTRQSIDTNRKISKAMKSFTVTPFEEVSKRLSTATKKNSKGFR